MIREGFKPTSFKQVAGARMKEEKWTGNIMRLYAERYYSELVKFEDIVKNDMTNKFFKEIEREIRNKEILKIQINGKPRLGKSTEAIVLGSWIKFLLKKYFKGLVEETDFGMNNMCRDDQEYTRQMRNPELMYNILVVDEQNALEKTGENATTEIAQKEVFTDVQAGRYVHTIYVCPEGDMDKNSDIKLEVRNREGGMIHNYLYYRTKNEWVILGYVDIDVSKLINNWKSVEPRFFNYLKNKEEKDRKYVEYWGKKDFYIEYMIKKYEKMELMNREGILRPRELDYAGIVLNVVNKTKGLVEIMSLQKIRNPIQSYVEMEFKEQKIPVSIIGVEMTSRRVLSVLTLMASKTELRGRLDMMFILMNKGKMNKGEYDKKTDEIKKHIEELDNLLNIQIAELKRYKEVNDKYNAHLR